MVAPSDADGDGDLRNGNFSSVDSASLLQPLTPRHVFTSGCQHHTPPVSSSYSAQNAVVGPFIIGVTGASASGKTTVCEKIIDGLGDQRCVLVSLDWFYHGIPDEVDPRTYNFDHPNAFDFDALYDTLRSMQHKKPVSVPMYDFTRHCRVEDNCAELDVADVIIVEGILSFYDPRIRDMMHMKIFVDEDADICLSRRIIRDAQARARSIESILKQYTTFVKPAFERFILPTKRHSDIVLPRGAENLVAIDLIIKHIALKIEQTDLRKVYSNLIVMADSYQCRGLHTIFRNADASRDDIVFYSNRLMRLVIEEGLGLLPFQRKSITTPSGGRFHGVGFVAGLAGVSLMPSGEAMENSLRAVCNTVRIGKMLIGRSNVEPHDRQGDEELVVEYEYLPTGLEERYVLLLAPVLNDGAKCETALKRLTGAEVRCREDRIVVLSLIVAPEAVSRICGRFAKVRLVVSAVDEGLDKEGNVFPGAGDFSRRYYGTE
ncbi:Uridine kinase-like protein 2, chloroplastic [Gracilariopsis chorda]|uniref:Uridine kinase-like protein 2, chloroplastic n=1 Tax=Gracilariopsis chorda TaxID=448386 RepID=A0A2V3IYX8_9FLOR|nr:Uridine kinase-like protein 2, chloroplastic [Gracilariopsis chorda]|eukprot:PXF47331.1 Uridine kinase-like protein 2, chloroplastic [Gracilariopsis chorda]